MREVFKSVARLILGEYGIYRVYQDVGVPSAVTQSVELASEHEVRSSEDAFIADQAWYAGDGCFAYVLRDESRVVGICFYWYGERYHSRRFWPLGPSEAKLVHIVTLPAFRGRGHASALIAGSAKSMRAQGWSALYARVWHTHESSWRAFERAGWRQVAIVVEVNPLRLSRPWRFYWRHPARSNIV